MSRNINILAVMAACVVFSLPGCGSSTDPRSGGAEFTYLPDAGSLTVVEGTLTSFQVTSVNVATYSVQWTVDDVVVSQSPGFSYLASPKGLHTVRAEVTYDEGNDSHQWVVTVNEEQSSGPPMVGSVEVRDGARPGSVRISWIAVAGSDNPVTDYLIGCSFKGNLDADNWDSADVLVDVPVSGSIGYVEELTTDDGMIPGSRAWFGVRALDDQGQLSPLPLSHSFLISYPWDLTGFVQDDAGSPLASVILSFESGMGSSSISSGLDGSFTQGPFSSADSIRVTAVAIDPEYYTFTSSYLHVSQAAQPLRITMLYKYGADATCNPNGGDFLSYLRYMTRTSDMEESSILHKWNSYPLRVFVPVFVRDDGVDFGSLCLQAMEYWNTAVGQDLLVQEAVAGDADVIVDFASLGPNRNGQVVLLEPQGVLGRVTPVHMRVDIDRDITGVGDVPTAPAVKGVCLHEFGHVLGLYEHSSCDGYRLMNAGNGTFAFQPDNPHPIAEDEINAVRSLRQLADGVDLAGYWR